MYSASELVPLGTVIKGSQFGSGHHCVISRRVLIVKFILWVLEMSPAIIFSRKNSVRQNGMIDMISVIRVTCHPLFHHVYLWPQRSKILIHGNTRPVQYGS